MHRLKIIGLAALMLATGAWAGDLSWKLWAQLRVDPGNIVYSPVSVQQALSLVALGAHHGALSVIAPLARQVAETNAMAKTMSDHGERLAIANGVWVQSGMHLLPAYAASARQAGAEATAVDFNTDTARQSINHFVSLHTAGHINQLLPPGLPSPATDLFIANAVYFKGTWQHAFDAGRTKLEPFTRAAGPTVLAHMMHLGSVDMAYAEAGTVQILAMPYQDGRMEMVLVLPAQADRLSEIETGVGTQFEAWQHALKPTSLSDVAVPRFKIAWHHVLNDALENSGLRSLFDGSADLSGIVGTPQKISVVLHAATISVNELGTVATAATAIGMTRAVMQKPSFIADHPFLFYIRDRQSGTILFTGRFADPTLPNSGG
ncbi:MAG TPA: serpin family protein [Candidatus Xenobia bacterium]|jgi:serpin B